MIEKLISWDTSIFLALNSINALWLNSLMTFLSGQLIWAPLIILILFISFENLTRKQFYLFAFFLLLAITATDATSSYIFKNYFKRLRPCRVEEIRFLMNSFGQKCGGRFGFISSHAANSFALLSFLFSSIKINRKAVHLLWILPMLISYSRIYMGVHYPGDVAIGATVGIFWGTLFGGLFKLRSEPT